MYIVSIQILYNDYTPIGKYQVTPVLKSYITPKISCLAAETLVA